MPPGRLAVAATATRFIDQTPVQTTSAASGLPSLHGFSTTYVIARRTSAGRFKYTRHAYRDQGDGAAPSGPAHAASGCISSARRRCVARPFQMRHHQLDAAIASMNDEMHMLGQDAAGENGVVRLGDRLFEAASNRQRLFAGEGNGADT